MTPLLLLRRRAQTSAVVAAVLLALTSVSTAPAGAAAPRIGAPAGDQGNAIAINAVAVMKQVRTVRSSGTLGGSSSSSRFTGVCVMSEPRARLSFHSRFRDWQIILISKPKQRDWMRSRLGTAPWSKWEEQATGPGDFNFPLLLPLACPRISLRDWRLNNTALHFHVAGSASIGGRQAWHLRASAGGASTHASRTIVEWYVDKGTYRLLHRRFTQLTAAGKPGYIEDVSYFGFDAAITILPPAR